MPSPLPQNNLILPGHLKNATRVYKGQRIDVCQLSVNGSNKEAVIHPGASVILPIKSDGSVVFIRNYRFAVGETLLELPAGTIDPGEKPLQTAIRELEEETGYLAGNIAPLTQFYPSPGFCCETLYSYVATDLTFVGQKLDENEEITVEEFSWTDVRHFIRTGIIKDAKSLITLLFYLTR